MRRTMWAVAIVVGGWLVTLVGYTLIGAVVAATWARPGEGAASDSVASTVTPGDLLSGLALAVLAGVVTWLGGVLATGRAGLAPRVAGTVAAAGPGLAVALTLLVFLAGGGIVWAAVAHAAAAALGAAVGLYAGARA